VKKVLYLSLLAICVIVCLTACGNPSTTTSGSNVVVTSKPASPAIFPGDNPDLHNPRSQIVVISDIHLGINDSFSAFVRNRSALVDFLFQIRNSPHIKELVIAGDLLDEWLLPMDYVMPTPESAFMDAIAANNPTVIEAFNQIIKDGNIKVTYVPGNHDMLVTFDDMQWIFPGINQARNNIQGLGAYVTGFNSEITIEHGHRYNFFVSPDPISSREITLNSTSVLPPGYFMNRIGTSSKVEGHPASGNVLPEVTVSPHDTSQLGYYLYAKAWAIILSQYPVMEAFSAKVIKTHVDGFTEDHAINDFVPQVDPQTGKLAVSLYQGIPDNWGRRQELNNVQVNIPLQDAILKAADDAFTDSQAKTQYFDRDSTARIVVFGHTHVARLDSYTNLVGQKTIYANTGTWIDNAQDYPTMTIVVITLPGKDSDVESVSLYQYSADKTITQLADTQVITIR
jgi:UDP-2,3-diacylglucosamine pyrophosphatase LpxH